MCLSNVSARFASSSRWKAEFSMNIPQNCHFTRWVPAIIFRTRFIMEMVFDFHFHRERRLRKKQYTVVLSHSLYPFHSLAYSLPLLPLSLSLFFLLFFSFFSCSPLPLFLFSHSHQMFPARFPDARHWARHWKQLQNHHEGVRTSISPPPCGWWQF